MSLRHVGLSFALAALVGLSGCASRRCQPACCSASPCAAPCPCGEAGAPGAAPVQAFAAPAAPGCCGGR